MFFVFEIKKFHKYGISYHSTKSSLHPRLASHLPQSLQEMQAQLAHLTKQVYLVPTVKSCLLFHTKIFKQNKVTVEKK